MTQDDDIAGPVDRSRTPGGLPQEPVEDRPNVGTVRPEDYPDAAQSKTGGPPSGTQSPSSLDEEMEDERRNPGSASRTPGGSGDGHHNGGEA